jgi:hypothetical protein
VQFYNSAATVFFLVIREAADRNGWLFLPLRSDGVARPSGREALL